MISPYVFPGIKEKELIVKNKKHKRTISNPMDVLKIVAENCGVTVEDVLSKCRKKEISEARHIFCVIMKKEFNFSLKRIGEFINNRDHTTVIHSVNTVKDRCDTEDGYKERVDMIINDVHYKI